MICLSENYYLVWSLYLQEKKSEALFFFSYVCDFDIRFSLNKMRQTRIGIYTLSYMV
ncbi:hypothetical protein HanHA300_Chr03g0114471 [Helianthus annuus]|nr:hypothetical protein HanHA300_Chr03g0114471 [Helianthus annuus]